MKPLRILLADDHHLFRAGIASLLKEREDMRIVGQAENGIEAVVLARQLMPDVILMDIYMPKCDGLQAARTIKENLPQVQIIMLTVSDRSDDVFEAIKCGASGYLLKDLEPQQLFNMLEKIRQGEAPISGAIAAKMLKALQPAEAGEDGLPGTKPNPLSPREIAVLREVVNGYSNKQIAEVLHVTENTIKIHMRNILDKLHVQNRLQAAIQAVREDLVDELAEVR